MITHLDIRNIFHNFKTILNFYSFSDTGKNASALVSSGASNLLLQILVTESKESAPRMAFMLQLHQLLAKIGSKGTNFISLSIFDYTVWGEREKRRTVDLAFFFLHSRYLWKEKMKDI